MTPKQAEFVRLKLAGLSNRAAVIEAGYSPGGAKQTGTYLMKHNAVKKALKQGGFSSISGKKLVAGFRKSSGPWLAISSSMSKQVYNSPMDFLVDAMNCAELPLSVRAQFAAALLPYQHVRMGAK